MTFSFMTDVAVSPATFHFHTPSLGKAMWRVQSKIPTANGSVASADMRVLSSQRSAEKEQMHSLMLTDSHLQRKTPDTDTITITIMDTTTVMDTTMVMATMGLAMAMMKIMVITRDTIMTMAKIAATVITWVIIIIIIIIMTMAVTMDKVRVIMGFNNKECRKIV